MNDFNYLNRTYQVLAQADEQFRRTPQDISRLKVRNATGAMVPIGSVATFKNDTPIGSRATTFIRRPTCSHQQQQQGIPTIAIFAASALFVFLVLAAQYESVKLPLAIVLIVPMCLLASATGLNFRGMPIDILAQIGFVVPV